METTMGFEVMLADPIDRSIERVTEALKTEGFGVLTRIDVKATLKEKIGRIPALRDLGPATRHGLQGPFRQPPGRSHAPLQRDGGGGPRGGSIVRIVNPEAMMSSGAWRTTRP